MAGNAKREQVLKEAWIGDAVLSLYVRRRILKEDGHVDGAKSARMTSNQFLNSVGEPSEVEAQIGRIFEEKGLSAAFKWIEATLLPMFDKQEANRRKTRT